jgi:hypothetical protein
MQALKQKARRGELFFTVAVGYVKVGREKIEMDPDLRVHEAIRLVFARFAEMIISLPTRFMPALMLLAEPAAG